MKPITVTNELIASLNPCRSRYYNYLKYYKNTKFDIIDFLELENITASDKIWVSVRILPSYILEVFIIDCAFCAAAYAAYAANYTGDAAAAAAGDAAYAANYAAYAANYTGDAAGDATRAAAGDAAYAATIAATRAAAAGDAAYAATRAAAGDAAYSQEQENQVDALIMLLKLNNYKPRRSKIK